jgi:hypothetical protein
LGIAEGVVAGHCWPSTLICEASAVTRESAPSGVESDGRRPPVRPRGRQPNRGRPAPGRVTRLRAVS